MKGLKNTLLLIVVLLFAPKSWAQDAQLVDKVKDYLEVNGTMKQYSDAYDELLNLMERQFPKSDRNSNGWIYLERNKTKALFEIKDLLAPIYINAFSAAELKALQKFFSSDAGKQLATDKTKLSGDQRKKVEAFYASNLGRSIKAKQPELSQEIATVSEYWSKDLYQTAVLLLKE